MKRLTQAASEGSCINCPKELKNLKTKKWKLAVNFAAKAGNLESTIHAIEKVSSEGKGKPAQFIPIRFIFTNKLAKNDKLLLAFDALMISKSLGRKVNDGKIIHGDNHKKHKVKVSSFAAGAEKTIEKILTLTFSEQPPDFMLNKHCVECEFAEHCRKKAIEKDDLSLLAGMSEKERKKLHSKGIFTVNQLSYTFRPRRRSKRHKNKPTKYQCSLKALAIRNNQIYVNESPQFQQSKVDIYLDIEGIPYRKFYYCHWAGKTGQRSAVQKRPVMHYIA